MCLPYRVVGKGETMDCKCNGECTCNKPWRGPSGLDEIAIPFLVNEAYGEEGEDSAEDGSSE